MNYREGDIFEIELGNDIKGMGKVLKRDEPSIFIELYKMVPAAKIEAINESDKYEPILSIWSTDSGFKKGLWKILKNQPITEEVIMPDFWKKDALNHDKIIMIRGNETFEVTKEEIGNAQPYGIFGHDAVQIRYAHELKQCGLL